VLIKGTFDGPAGANSYADLDDWESHFPVGIGLDGTDLGAAIAAAPDPFSHRLIMASRWVDGLQFLTGYARVTDADDAAAVPPSLSLPRSSWYAAEGSPWIHAGTCLNTSPPSVPACIIAAVCEVAEVMRLNGCWTTDRVQHPAGVAKSVDVHLHVSREFAAPLASQLYRSAHRYLAGLAVLPGNGRRMTSY